MIETSFVPLLLADRSPCLRYLVLTELLMRDQSDAEVAENAELRQHDPLVAGLVSLQLPDGSWKGVDSRMPDAVTATAKALTRLGYLGFDRQFEAVARGAGYLVSRQGSDGSWPLPDSWRDEESGVRKGRERYTMIPLQTALPLRGLTACGFWDDAFAERAWNWLLCRRLDDGSWPTGVAGDVYGYVAGYRRLPHTSWGCRSNTTAALICLSLHPRHRRGHEARRALDLLLARETREQYTLGYEVSRVVGIEPWRGFLTSFARFDLGLIADLCWRVGACRDDDRVEALVEFLESLQGAYGLWEYAAAPQASRWITFDILRSLWRLEKEGDWVGREPRTPFSAYPARRRRY